MGWTLVDFDKNIPVGRDLLFLDAQEDVIERKVLIEKFPIGHKQVLKIKRECVKAQNYGYACIVRDYEKRHYSKKIAENE